MAVVAMLLPVCVCECVLKRWDSRSFAMRVHFRALSPEMRTHFGTYERQAEEANLPETMCRLTEGMRSIEELRALMRTAKDLMLNTPKSFRKILRSALYANLSQVRPNGGRSGGVAAVSSRLPAKVLGGEEGGRRSAGRVSVHKPVLPVLPAS